MIITKNRMPIRMGTVLLLLFSLNILFGQLGEYTQVKTALVTDLDSLNLKTGDLAFFQSLTFDGVMTQLGTLSPFTHSSMIVVAEDGSIWLTHATNNDYKGYQIPVIGEEVGRSGVILTRLDDLFISVDNGKSGYYHHIWIRKLKDERISRPSTEQILKLYQKYKAHPFETSNLRFILTSFDLNIAGKDLLYAPADSLWMCSEYMVHIFDDLNYPLVFKEEANEVTPIDVYRKLDGYYEDPVIYHFKNGKYTRQ